MFDLAAWPAYCSRLSILTVDDDDDDDYGLFSFILGKQ